MRPPATTTASLVLNVVNRHRDQPIEVEFEAQDKQFAGPVEVAEVNGPDIKAENDFGVTKVQTVTRPPTPTGEAPLPASPAFVYDAEGETRMTMPQRQKARREERRGDGEKIPSLLPSRLCALWQYSLFD